MRLEHYSEEKLKKEILEIVGKYLDLSKYKIFFFGSRVAGTGDERSDIDVGIEGRTPLPSGALLDIQDALENLPTLYKVEIVDFSRVDERFKKVAKEHIEVIK
jgi:predicted nucleotidyltransferase